ncbi:MAG: ABC transporter ATP-binding protein [Candidatus Thermoplasmatota archaeon]|nr:ABC transporter ATP-binding protein [Candidatus Thermoplasmatota archaeon]
MAESGSARLIELKDIQKYYKTGKVEFHALRGVNMTIAEGELVAIVGPSGCGKSTMLNMITGIDKPTSGDVVIDGDRIDTMKEDQLAAWRGENVGIIFQFFQLFPTLTTLENAMLPMDFAKKGTVPEREEIAKANLELVGLGDKLNNLPYELSGGEQQRVAIARSLANDPKLIIGDEPTGNLDSKTEGRMFDLFKKLNDSGKTVVFVTHSKTLAEKAHRRIEMLDGQIMEG